MGDDMTSRCAGEDLARSRHYRGRRAETAQDLLVGEPGGHGARDERLRLVESYIVRLHGRQPVFNGFSYWTIARVPADRRSPGPAWRPGARTIVRLAGMT
jgi:hypothetical protein